MTTQQAAIKAALGTLEEVLKEVHMPYELACNVRASITQLTAIQEAEKQGGGEYPAKIKTWPERIWLQHGLDEELIPKYIEVCDGEDGITWCQDHIEEFDIPYIRADLASPQPVSQQSTAQSKLVLALPDYEKAKIVIVSDEIIDDERVVCIAIRHAPVSKPEVVHTVQCQTCDKSSVQYCCGKPMKALCRCDALTDHVSDTGKTITTDKPKS
jgi:hypothetical protein